MNKISKIVSVLVLVASATCTADPYMRRPCYVTDSGVHWTPRNELSSQIPQISLADVAGKRASNAVFKMVPDVAQYKGADWSQAVGISYGITEDEAMQIAKSNPKITYFFRTKGFQMILETESGDYRRFRHGDTVFFTGTPWFGSAPGLADGYVKQ